MVSARISAKRVKGFTIVELLVVLVVSAGAIGLTAQYLDNYSNALVNQTAAEQQKKVADAASAYIKDNYAVVLSVATATSPAVITTAMLKSTGYLSANFSDTNAFGQTYSVRALEPSLNKLETLVVTVGGDTVNDINLKRAAQLVGASGGYVSYFDTANAIGSFGGWKIPLANYGISPGAGHLVTAMMFADAALLSDYLYRNAVVGHPEFNRMNTALDMAGHDINNGGAFNATTVSASQDVNAGRNITATSTVSAGLDVSAGRNVSGVNNVSAGQNVTAGHDVSASNNVSAGANVTAGHDVQATNMVRANGRVSAGEYLQVDGSATEGVGCSPNGLLAQGGGAGLLVCVGGRWKTVGNKPYVDRGYTSTGFIPTPWGHTGCTALKVPDAYQYYSGGRNDPDGRTLWTDYPSDAGWYIQICTD